MSDIVAFLTARLAEDERSASAARGVVPLPSRPADGKARSRHFETHMRDMYLVHWTPERMLAEVEAKRRLVHAHAHPHECISLTDRGDRSVVDGQPWELWEPEHTDDHGPCFVLRCLALPYADHPDYRQEWRS